MGGYLQEPDVTGYGWVKRDCKEVLVRAMCRLDCEIVEPVTNEPVSTEVSTEQFTTDSTSQTQYLMYTVLSSKKLPSINSYTLHVDQNPLKNGQFTIPYSAEFPCLSFNYQLNVLEVVGDWYSTANSEHQRMTISGSFSNANSSLFKGDSHFEVAYS